MKKALYVFGLIVLATAAISCKKDADKSTLEIRLTDAPGPFSAVNIDIQSIEITGDSSNAIMLDVTPAIVNLLDFSNGLDTIIGTGSLEPGKVEQIRLVLGSNNSVTVDGITYPLSTPSAEQSGLKLQVHQTFEAGVKYSILLDFDAYHSIVETGNGTFKLKPVIRTIDTAISGSISGAITPAGTLATVKASFDGNLYSTAVNADGKFVIIGLPAGTYSLRIIHNLSADPVDVDGVLVTIGKSTNIGVVDL